MLYLVFQRKIKTMNHRINIFENISLFTSFTILFSLFIGVAFAQQLPSNPIGLNPHSLKWKQIDTDKVQVIFPEGLENQGNRVANLVHYLWENSNESVGEKQKKVSILLQNQTTIPNGFVTVGPFRSEFYMTPPQFNINGTGDWLDLLAIHEYRHVKQFSNARRGVTKLAKTLFGSWAWGGFAGLALPRWYWEGDAVGTETALTNAGRGRLPEFDMEYKALIMNGLHYNYEKAGAGSLKDFVPNHYNLGYYLTTYARRNFGEDVLQKVVRDATAYKGILYPFSRNLKKHTGLRTKQLYENTWKDLEKMWQNEKAQLKLTASKRINQKHKRTFTNYKNAQYTETGDLIAEKNSFSQIRTFYLIDSTGKETLLTLPGINVSNNTTLSLAKNQICWAELGFGERWGNQDFSIIKTYNFTLQEKQKLTSRSRYFAPAFSPDATQIVAVEITTDLKYNLVILSAFDGKVIKKIANPENDFLAFPRFKDDGKSIICVAQKGESNWLQQTFIQDETNQKLTEPSTFQISNPFPKGEFVYFSAAHTGINNIFALKIADKTIYHLTSVALGAFQPAVSADGKRLVYSNFTAKGYDLEEIVLSPESWQVFNANTPNTLNYFEPLAEQEGGSIISKVGNEKFAVKKYSKWSGIINPHSLVPYLLPPVVGARILADNKFSTLSAEVGAYYNGNENEMTYSASLSYAELYPVLQAGFDYSNRERSFSYFTPTEDNQKVTGNFFNQSWNEKDFYVGIALPFNLTSGTMRRRLTLSANYHFLDLDFNSAVENPNFDFDTLNATPNRLKGLLNTPLQKGMMNSLETRLVFNSQQALAEQHINPRFWQYLDIRYLTTVGGGNNRGKTFYSRLDLYFPGLFKNHSLYFNFAYQAEKFVDNYKFRNLFFYPRGYDASVLSDNIFKFGANYTLPLLYPDLKLGSFAFLKRIKANFFGDFARFNAPYQEAFIFYGGRNTMNSLGVELTFDIRILRLLEVDLGVRYSYALNPSFTSTGQSSQLEFILMSVGI